MNVPTTLTIVLRQQIAPTPTDHSFVLVGVVILEMALLAQV